MNILKTERIAEGKSMMFRVVQMLTKMMGPPVVDNQVREDGPGYHTGGEWVEDEEE